MKSYNIYPEAICMHCSQVCDIWEEVDVGGGEWELWCYCKKCKLDTFHPAIKEDHENKSND